VIIPSFFEVWIVEGILLVSFLRIRLRDRGRHDHHLEGGHAPWPSFFGSSTWLTTASSADRELRADLLLLVGGKASMMR
jgi:hypothetical protein